MVDIILSEKVTSTLLLLLGCDLRRFDSYVLVHWVHIRYINSSSLRNKHDWGHQRVY